MTRSKAGRPGEGLSKQLTPRVTDDEAQMVRDVAALLGTSQQRAVRWAIRYAHQHATSTTDHQTCPKNSPCSAARLGITPGGKRRSAPDTVPEGQTLITHTATVE